MSKSCSGCLAKVRTWENSWGKCIPLLEIYMYLGFIACHAVILGTQSRIFVRQTIKFTPRHTQNPKKKGENGLRSIDYPLINGEKSFFFASARVTLPLQVK